MSDDARSRRYINPTRVSWPPPAPNAPPGAERLCHESLGQATVWREPLCVLSQGVPGRTDTPLLLCDFGRELHGGLQVVTRNTTANQPVSLLVTFGESIAEALGQPNQDHAIHQHLIRVPWAGIHEVGSTGFRFTRIELAEPNTFIELLGLRAISVMRCETPIGEFECSDPLLNSIWQTGAYTLQLCMQEYLWDGIKRDRLVWAGDLHPEVMTLLNVFGAHPIVPSSLQFLRNDAPLPAWMNGMPTYSLWWLISLRDWWLHTADRATLEQNRSYVLALLSILMHLVDERGSEQLPSRFLDWATANDPAAVALGTHALMRIALRAGADLCEVLGEGAIFVRCIEARDRSARYIPPPLANQQANALRVLSGLSDARETNRSVFVPDPLKGLSPFYAYYVLEARALAGDHAGCLDLIRRYWGGMLEMGATSFWEHFDLAWLEGDRRPTRIDEWPIPGRLDIHRDFGDHCYQGFRHSLCHAWSSGPTAWLSRRILGVTPAAPGFARAHIKPNLASLQWARGTVPTPHGPIRISHERQAGGRVETHLELPEGVISLGQ
jgi:alpha-L-rhamnosidase